MTNKKLAPGWLKRAFDRIDKENKNKMEFKVYLIRDKDGKFMPKKYWREELWCDSPQKASIYHEKKYAKGALTRYRLHNKADIVEFTLTDAKIEKTNVLSKLPKQDNSESELDI